MSWLSDFLAKVFPPKPKPQGTSVVLPLPVPSVEKPGEGVGSFSAADVQMTARLCGVSEDAVLRAPHMIWMAQHNGWDEAHKDSELAKLVWPHTNYRINDKLPLTVTGATYAWCKATCNTALVAGGFDLEANYSAGAVDARRMGVNCTYVFGAILPITHYTGKHHVGFFVRWLDERAKVALVFGGNQSNALCIAAFNLSGNKSGHDEVIPGPRWPRKLAV